MIKEVDTGRWWNSLFFSWFSFILVYLVSLYFLVTGVFDKSWFRIFVSGFVFIFLNAILFFGERIKNYFLTELGGL